MTWSQEQLNRIRAADELEIAARHSDGSLHRWTPIWAVVVGDQVYVRTWYRRETGWFGRALQSGRARVRVPGLEMDVTIEDVGADQDGVDAAYEAKYRRYGASSVNRMVAPEAADTTLRLRA